MVPEWGLVESFRMKYIVFSCDYSLAVEFQITSMIITLSRIPGLHGGLGRTLGVLTEDLKDRSYFTS